DQARHTDAVGPHLKRHLLAVRPRDDGAHRQRILGAEIESLADLDAARGDQFIAWDRAAFRSMYFTGRGIKGRPVPEKRLEVAVVIDVLGQDLGVEPAPVAEHLRLSGLGEDLELMR